MKYDVVVIGAGPGGYVAAIRAAQLGFKTAVIEKYPVLGGTCLNVGCIPSKTLLHASELYHETQSKIADFGIDVEGVSLDVQKMMGKKGKVVKGLTQGIASLFKKNKITHHVGFGRLLGDGRIELKSGESAEVVEATHIIIATGSKPVELPFMPFNGDSIVDSTGALQFNEVPEDLIVIGAGVIGLELGSVWMRLGAKVKVVEFLDRVAVTMDHHVSKELQRVLKKQGMSFHLSTKVTSAEVVDGRVHLQAVDKRGETVHFDASKVLVAVGRRPYTQGLGLKELGVKMAANGCVEIDAHFQTSIPGVYAIGDVVRGPMLAHKAEDEGIAVAETIAGKSGHVNYAAIPSIIYTTPEVSAVGLTETEIKEKGIPFKTGKFPFRANSRSRCVDDVDGFVKIIAHGETDRILGVHMIGPSVSELIQEAVLAIEYQASSEDLARTVHGHPGFGEAIKEAALDLDGRAIHF